MIVGLGQCGGNIADVAETSGFTTMAINSYQGDLDSLKRVSDRIHLNGYNGAGKNRENGKDALKDNLEQTINAIITKADQPYIEIIMVAFSADGGTGSGSGPLLMDVLTEVLPNKIISGIIVMPTLDESIGALANTSECISELSNIEGIGACLFVDNDKVMNEYKISKKQMYAKTNLEIVQHLSEICNSSQEKSSDGNFDQADLLAVLSARGAMIIAKNGIPVNSDEINNTIKSSWDRRSTFVTPENDGKIVNSAFIYHTTELIVSKVNKSQLFAELGTPIEIFEGYYEVTNQQTVTTILSGLSFPYKKLNKMEEVIELHKPKIEKNIESSLTQKFENKSGWVGGLKNNRKKEVPSKQSITDRLKRFQ
jgi:cell division GTPase FtsZ